MSLIWWYEGKQAKVVILHISPDKSLGHACIQPCMSKKLSGLLCSIVALAWLQHEG